jgi:hypothetical protein
VDVIDLESVRKMGLYARYWILERYFLEHYGELMYTQRLLVGSIRRLGKKFLVIAILILLSAIAEARLELTLLRPAEEFVTNNSELVVEGVVRRPEAEQVVVSVSTPVGEVDLDFLDESLHVEGPSTLQSLTVDLGSAYSLKTMVLLPVFEGELSLGPRVVDLSFSSDGDTFENRGVFNCTSGMGREYGEARVEFGTDIEARYVQMDMLAGWQADRIVIQEVGFLDSEGDLHRAKVRSVSVSLHLNEDGEAHFQMVVFLIEGENVISIVARMLDPVEEEIEERFELITANYVHEVVVEEEPLILSDGYKAELSIPSEALASNIKKIGIRPLDVNQVEWRSYSENVRIVRNTLPVVVYEFEVSAETPFPATAKDSLERQPPSLAVDGKTEYPSTWMTTTSALPVWLEVDLREPHLIGKVVITARVENGISYGPKRLSVMISDDDVSYTEAARCDECDDSKTEIRLLDAPTARYVQIVIEDGKQGNNIQINEVEFYDDEDQKILSYMKLSSAALARPAELAILYDDVDLTAAGVLTEKNLGIFSWNDGMQEWEMLGGKVDTADNLVTVNLNYLSRFALFEAVARVAEVRWSYNPFSPNGDGIADKTTISINLNGEIEGQVRVEIFDLNGKLIRTLVHEEAQSGHISIVWDGNDENGEQVSIGAYIYQVIVGKEIRNGVLVVAR